jgi:hypothetical protein
VEQQVELVGGFTSGSSRQVHWPSQTGHISVSSSSGELATSVNDKR